MSSKSFSVPESMQKCISSLVEELNYGEKFLFLTGASGSGKTSLCEHVVNALENRFTTVFIPCQKEMSIERLRQLFLQQAAPSGSWDESEPLDQSFSSLSIPVRQKLLVVIDDVDFVISSYFDEFIRLYEQNLGKNRFSFLITAHPLWAQTKISSSINDKLNIKEYEIPRLSSDEALKVTRQMFESSGLEKVYSVILPKLPKALEACEGNLNKIIKLTETFMADPVEVEKEQDKVKEEKTVVKNKKHNSTGVFVSIICIIIVLACLVPVFLGTNVIDKIFGKSGPDTQQPQTQTQTQVKTTEAGDASLGFGDESEAEAQTQPQEAQQQAATPSDDPLAVSAGAVNDVTAQGPKGDKDNAVADEGALLPEVQGGVEAEEVKPTTKNQVTIQGEALDAIEGKEADSQSGNPRRGLAGSLNKNSQTTDQAKKEQDQKTAAPVKEEPAKAEKQASANEAADKTAAAEPVKIEVLTRSDSILYKDRIEKEDAELASRKKAEAEVLALKQQAEAQANARREAQAKQLADALVKAQNEARKEEPAAAPEKETKKTAAAKTDSNDKKTKTQSAQASNAAPAPQRTASAGHAVAGDNAEIDALNSNHYTLQVLAGRDRASLVSASRYLTGKYWIYTTKRNDRPWYVLITGDYSTPNEAVRESRSLPASLRSAGPFAKTFDRVKTEIRNQ